METVVDPKGTQTKSLTNAMGQTVFTVQNFTSFASLSSPGNTAADKDVATAYAYNGLGNLESLTAGNPTTGNQITRYLYEDPINASLETSAIYPDSSDTSASGTDQVKTAYYLDGSVKKRTDQNGTVHTYAYDAQRREIADEVTTLGSGIDGAVRKITKTYNSFGALETINSLDASNNVVNQNRYEYDTNQNLFKLYSNPSGAVNTGSTPYIQYAYDTTKTLRPTSMTYPSGTTVNYAYGTSGGIEDLASRPVTIANGSTTLATYQYTGSGQPMKTTYNQPNISLAYANGGLDRFGRIIDHAWKNSGGTSLIQIKHGYDYAGNRTYREDVAATNAGKTCDELYAYDGVNQVKSLDRGTLNSGKTAVTSKNFAEVFTFDKTGNFANYKQDTIGAGTYSVDQNRVHSKANEITSIGGSTANTGVDANGNMTKVVKPDNWSVAYTLVYDAWNRLVQVKDGSTTVATYFYDGTNRRVKKIVGSETRVFYFNRDWQCVEEYVGSTCDVRFVWGLRYVDDLVTYRNGSTDYYVLQDANWNVVALTNASGVVQERYTYSSFGKLNVFDAAFVPKSASTFGLTRSFTGQVLDSETGLMLYRHRVYHPALGRFIQRDPIEYEAGDENLMRYVRNISTSLIDALGMQIIAMQVIRRSNTVTHAPGGCGCNCDDPSHFPNPNDLDFPSDPESTQELCLPKDTREEYNECMEQAKLREDVCKGNAVESCESSFLGAIGRACWYGIGDGLAWGASGAGAGAAYGAAGGTIACPVVGTVTGATGCATVCGVTTGALGGAYGVATGCRRGYESCKAKEFNKCADNRTKNEASCAKILLKQ